MIVALPTVSPSPAPTTPLPPEEIIIPAIGLDAPVVPLGWMAEEVGGAYQSRWEPLPQGAAGWHRDSGCPGAGTNIVLSGHHNIEGQVFRDLIGLEVGDRISIRAGQATYDYEVAEKLLLPEKDMPEGQRVQNASWMWPTREERLTLITCWPYESNTHRLVVWARPVAGASGVYAQAN